MKLGEGDEGMIHSVLTGLPEFVDHDYGQLQDSVQGCTTEANPESAEADLEPFGCMPPQNAVDQSPLNCKVPKNERNTLESDLDVATPIEGPASESFSPDPPTSGVIAMTFVGVRGAQRDSVHLHFPHLHHPHDEDASSTLATCSPSASPSPPQRVIPIASTFQDPADIPLPPSVPPTRPASPVSVRPTTPLSLSSVLILADKLSTRFPPDTPELRLTHTLGPASAMRTWAQDASLMPSDEQAEALVVAGVDIVVRDAPKPERRKAKTKRKQKVIRETRLLVAGAVLVLGAAVVYGVRVHRGSAAGGLDIIDAETEWRALVGALGVLGDKLLGVFGEGHFEL